MRELLPDLVSWWSAGAVAGTATVTRAWSSAPREPGAAMAVGPAGTVLGSVSGGCVEAAVLELASDARTSGRSTVQRFGVADDVAAGVGLTCGGTIELLVEPVCRTTFPQFGDVAADVAAGRPVAVATVVGGGAVGARMIVGDDRHDGTLGSAWFDGAVLDSARGLLGVGHSAVVHLGPDGGRRPDDVAVFVRSYAPPPRMIVFGAIDFAAAVARAGAFLGYRVTVCDARAAFATAARFPDAHDVVVDWPHRYLARTATDDRTVVCVLTHDPKFDVPLLELALRRPLGYVGAMGSRRTCADRERQLRERGLGDADLARLHAPIGLDIGARTPAETAVAVAAEIVRHRRGGSGLPLRASDGPIHRRGVASAAGLGTPAA